MTGSGKRHDRGQAMQQPKQTGFTADEFIAWALPTGAPYNPTPLVYGDLYYTLFDRGLLTVDRSRLRIHYERYDEAVATLLAAVLELQASGDRDAANEFVERWTSWDEPLHGAVARRMRESETTRFTLVRYEALGESPAR